MNAGFLEVSFFYENHVTRDTISHPRHYKWFSKTSSCTCANIKRRLPNRWHRNLSSLRPYREARVTYNRSSFILDCWSGQRKIETTARPSRMNPVHLLISLSVHTQDHTLNAEMRRSERWAVVPLWLGFLLSLGSVWLCLSQLLVTARQGKEA